MKNTSKDKLDKTLRVLIALMIVALVITAVLYRYKFNGSLSSEPNSWSAFGSFFGGIFGPLISFAALIAILKTIQLQKEIILEQRSEFEGLINSQSTTNDIQSRHLLAAEGQLKDSKLANYISNNIVMLELQINLHQSIIQRCNESLSQIKELVMVHGVEVSKVDDTSKDLNKKIKESEETIKVLSKISIQITVGEFQSIDEVKSKIRQSLPRPL